MNAIRVPAILAALGLAAACCAEEPLPTPDEFAAQLRQQKARTDLLKARKPDLAPYVEKIHAWLKAGMPVDSGKLDLDGKGGVFEILELAGPAAAHTAPAVRKVLCEIENPNSSTLIRCVMALHAFGKKGLEEAGKVVAANRKEWAQHVWMIAHKFAHDAAPLVPLYVKMIEANEDDDEHCTMGLSALMWIDWKFEPAVPLLLRLLKDGKAKEAPWRPAWCLTYGIDDWKPLKKDAFELLARADEVDRYVLSLGLLKLGWKDSGLLPYFSEAFERKIFDVIRDAVNLFGYAPSARILPFCFAALHYNPEIAPADEEGKRKIVEMKTEALMAMSLCPSDPGVLRKEVLPFLKSEDEDVREAGLQALLNAHTTCTEANAFAQAWLAKGKDLRIEKRIVALGVLAMDKEQQAMRLNELWALYPEALKETVRGGPEYDQAIQFALFQAPRPAKELVDKVEERCKTATDPIERLGLSWTLFAWDAENPARLEAVRSFAKEMQSEHMHRMIWWISRNGPLARRMHEDVKRWRREPRHMQARLTSAILDAIWSEDQ